MTLSLRVLSNLRTIVTAKPCCLQRALRVVTPIAAHVVQADERLSVADDELDDLILLYRVPAGGICRITWSGCTVSLALLMKRTRSPALTIACCACASAMFV